MLIGRGIDGSPHVFHGGPRPVLLAKTDVKITGSDAVSSAVTGDDDVRLVGGNKEIPLEIFSIDGFP